MTATTTTSATRRYQRRGTIYLLVLGTALIVTIIGVSALTVARIQTQAVAGGNDAREAGMLAFSAMEDALALLAELTVDGDPLWRTSLISDVESAPIALGRGTISWMLVDPDDGDLTDDTSDPVQLYGIGRVGAATRIYTVLLQPQGGDPLDVLRTTVHAAMALEVDAGKTLNAVEGPVSSNEAIWNGGTIDGDAEAPVFAGSGGTITGTQTITDAKTMPAENIFDTLVAQATEIPAESIKEATHYRLEGAVLSAAVNPTGGPTNSLGIYYTYVPAGKWIEVRVCRIKGTLVISGDPGASVQVDRPILWEPHSGDFPILVVKGDDIEVTLQSPPTDLVEAALSLNLNPPGTPYNGEEDALLDDTYPSELRGLIHIINDSLSTTYLASDVSIRGTVIAHGMVTVQDATVTHDPNLYENPPEGYTAGGQMTPIPGTWRRCQLP